MTNVRSKKEYQSTLGPKLVLISESYLPKDKEEIFDSPSGMTYLSNCFKSKFKSADTHVTYVKDNNYDGLFTKNVMADFLYNYFIKGTLDFNTLVFAFVGYSAYKAFFEDYEKGFFVEPTIRVMLREKDNLIVYSDDRISKTKSFEIPYVVLPEIDDNLHRIPSILNSSSVGKTIEKSPYCSTVEIISKFKELIELYQKELIKGFNFEAKLCKEGKKIEYFKIYDCYTNDKLLYCRNDEICLLDSDKLKREWVSTLKELLTTVPVYSSDEENLNKIVSLFGYKDQITVISEQEGSASEDKTFKVYGDEKGEPSEWYTKWYKDVFKAKLKNILSEKEIIEQGYNFTKKYEWIYDIEVFKYDWLFIAKTVDGKNKVVCWNDGQALSKWIKDKILIGFNNAAYDDVVIKHAMLYPYLDDSAPTVKEYSDLIIEDHELAKRYPLRPEFKTKKRYEIAPAFLSWDLNFHMPFDIRRNSLKKLTMSVLNRRNYDSSVPFNIGTSLSMKQRKEVEQYCEMDVDNTRDLFLPDPEDIEKAKENPKHKFREFARDSYDIRWNLIIEFGMGAKTLINKAASFASKVLCGEDAKPNPDNTYKEIDGKKVYYSIPELAYKELAGTPLLDFYIKNQTNPNYITEKFEYYMGGNDEGHLYQFGFGGLHQALIKYGSKNLVNMDVASLYPSLLVVYNLMSRGASNPDAYKDVYHTRLKAKKEGNTLLNLGLKLILNGSIGAMLSQYNALFDSWSNSTICTYGQLLLFILAKRLYEAGFNIIQTNTDGIMIEKQADVDFMPIAEKWMEETGLVLEFDDIAILQQNNVNNYYCQFTNGKIKSKGFYLSNEKFGKATSKILCNLVTERPPLEGTSPRDFVIYKKHSIGEIYDGITREKLDGRSLAFVVGFENDPRTQEYYSRSRNARKVVKKDEKGKPILDEFGDPVTEIVNTESKITGFTPNMLLVDDVNSLTMEEINTDVYINFAKNLLDADSIFGPYYAEDYVKSETPAYLQALNSFKDNLAEYPTRAGVYNQNLLFECDYLTKEEQEELIEPIKDKLYRVVWSGHRSYHIVVRLSRPVKVNEYKIIWYYLMYKLHLTGADEMCSMANRYTRTPNQINPKTGEMQTLYCESKYVWNVDELIEQLPKLKEQVVLPKKFTGKNITKEALIRHINKQDWSEGNRFVAVQKLSPVLMSTVKYDELLTLIPTSLDKNHKYVLRSKYHYFERNKENLIESDESNE